LAILRTIASACRAEIDGGVDDDGEVRETTAEEQMVVLVLEKSTVGREKSIG
jgi:hypothetical protein